MEGERKLLTINELSSCERTAVLAMIEKFNSFQNDEVTIAEMIGTIFAEVFGVGIDKMLHYNTLAADDAKRAIELFSAFLEHDGYLEELAEQPIFPERKD